ncbi:MAG TPA: tetratricopeptide repeat protein [Azospirillaceae bacterium]|nr:tetratricopeptide repeat protein [Azospirillaceae bacterium]
MKRKLVAILAADIEGYTAHMQRDEGGTLERMQEVRRIAAVHIGRHGGRIANTAGDSLLVEFASAVDAAECATALQLDLARWNARGSHTPMRLRIGLNIGEVFERDGDLFGDAVNVAARLQGIAEAGGVYLSSLAAGQLAGRCKLDLEPVGRVELKNVDEPVEVLRVHLPEVGAESPLEADTVLPPQASPTAITAPVPQVPSIAVLPFAPIGNDPVLSYMAEGLAEEIVTALSRMQWLRVIAHAASKGMGGGIGPREAARTLGVRYVLDGSVRAAGGRMRVTARLMEGDTGAQIWAERYDGVVEDVFDVQDDISRRIVSAIEPEMLDEERLRAARTGSLDAWGLVVQALALCFRIERQDNLEAQRLARRAVALDPGYARAHGVLGWAVLWEGFARWAPDEELSYAAAEMHAREGVRLDPTEPWARVSLAHALSCQAKHDEAVQEFRAALEVHPNFALARTLYGWALLRRGDFDAAIRETGEALRLSPTHSFSGFHTSVHGLALLGARRFADALPYLREAAASYPGYYGHHRALASCCGHLGLLDEGRAALERATRLIPGIDLVGADRRLQGYAHREVFIEGLRKAGLK